MVAAVADSLPHPFDPLSAEEIRVAIDLVKKAHGQLNFHAVSLLEPRKTDVVSWQADEANAPHPARIAEVTAIGLEGKVYDGFIDLATSKITKWETLEGVQPIITMEELNQVEKICRQDPKVIEQCELSGIPNEDMHKVYCDPWTIGYDERFGSNVRLQQALMYYRPNVDDCQYQYPLDFCPIYDGTKKAIIAIDVPKVRRPLPRLDNPINYHPAGVEKAGGYRSDIKPINITQPEGVSFKLKGRNIEWQNWSFHIGFNYREGIVLNDIKYNERGTLRPIFYRLSLAEMVVPYGNPEFPHQRKHAFDLGEYGAGYMTNSLSLGCDCKGVIHYLDADFPTQDGNIRTIKNAICIHEEDAGILFKHSDFRDESVIVTRARKLIIQQVFTAANYEYAIQWIFHDGTIQPEIKLTGILNTYVMNPGEDLGGWGTQVYPGVNAHNHQHLFCLRVHANVDGPNNTVFVSDTVPSGAPVGSPENLYGNAFYAKRTKLATEGDSKTDYDGGKSRTWEICNPNKLHPYSGKATSYKLVSREVPNLLPKEGSLVWKRAGFARHAVHVTKCRHVPQTSGEPTAGLPEWMGDGCTSIDNTDIVLWHTFGVTHIPAPEDFPVMPVEPITLLLRPRNFFSSNPVMDVPPSFCSTPSQVAANGAGVLNASDRMSKLAFGENGTAAANGSGTCCGSNGTNGTNGANGTNRH